MDSAQLSHTAFFFDFDGTLSAIGPDPEKVRPVDDAPEALAALAGQAAYCAVVSARPVAFLAAQLHAVPGIQLHGLYGLEYSADGGATVTTLPEAAPYRPVIDEAARAAAEELPTALVEHKGLSCAVHYRNTPELADAVELWAAGYATEHGLKVQRGRMVVELKPPVERDKGHVVREVLEQTPDLAGGWFFGDDLGDRPAFAALAERAEREPVFKAVRVAVANPEGDPLSDLADLMLDRPEEVPGVVRRLLR
ncbi:trehalose-phosphatase [Actinospica sp.]|jgi:trehalose 6-phosphate phosphatase|uniref:trehalose-phosphatase n=1 Tax=Actinospica sp. TaxID=1872142 RepID=UPI002C26DF57|nr:trehalose-phosphatase [Actinospica sp.]HWG27485.1 trehalose-phosphatase [Actinospica sp.]